MFNTHSQIIFIKGAGGDADAAQTCEPDSSASSQIHL